MFNTIAAMSDEIGSKKSPIIRLAKLTEEVGEFATEVSIATGNCHKEPGIDGVIGEGADVIITALDIVHRCHPDLTQEQFMEVVNKKLAKWKRVAAVAALKEQ